MLLFAWLAFTGRKSIFNLTSQLQHWKCWEETSQPQHRKYFPLECALMFLFFHKKSVGRLSSEIKWNCILLTLFWDWQCCDQKLIILDDTPVNKINTNWAALACFTMRLATITIIENCNSNDNEFGFTK